MPTETEEVSGQIGRLIGQLSELRQQYQQVLARGVGADTIISPGHVVAVW